MKRLLQMAVQLLQGLAKATARFPLTVASLVGSTWLACYIISLEAAPDLLTQKLLFTFLVGAFVGVTAQFACERFSRMGRQRALVYAVSLLLILGYYLILAQTDDIDFGVAARTLVAIFALFCAFIWLPSYRSACDFNSVALVHFKSAYTAILYAGVLSMGLAALLFAIDLLLFTVDFKVYGYMLSIVWLLFAAIYYLSLLPRFNSDRPEDRAFAAEACEYPDILNILVSRIAIPLLAAYTGVLFAYFAKIGLTRQWPIGQLGPLILAYSAAGLVIYVLASRLKNRPALLYQRAFPPLLIPIVLMQLVSVYIRLQAYGVTESRYYVALFGIFSLTVGAALSFRPVTRNSLIALLAAGFAIVSIIPPVDAFTVSRQSQVARLERLLETAGILEDGRITPQAAADREVRRETTNILNYLSQRGHLERVSWLPADFSPARDMQQTFGFGPTYQYDGPQQLEHFNARLADLQAIPISGYDVFLQAESQWSDEPTVQAFQANGRSYQLVLNRLSLHDVRVSLQDAAGTELVGTNLADFVSSLRKTQGDSREQYPLDQMTLEVANGGYRLRIIFQWIQAFYGHEASARTHYGLVLMIAFPD
ncbi:MAG: DUF4153 domain-containing protein [Bacillota bacterium]|jgi:hypothetical protein